MCKKKKPIYKTTVQIYHFDDFYTHLVKDLQGLFLINCRHHYYCYSCCSYLNLHYCLFNIKRQKTRM